MCRGSCFLCPASPFVILSPICCVCAVRIPLLVSWTLPWPLLFPWGSSFISASGCLLGRIQSRGTFTQNRTGAILRFFLLFPLSSTDHRQYWSWTGHGNICLCCAFYSVTNELAGLLPSAFLLQIIDSMSEDTLATCNFPLESPMALTVSCRGSVAWVLKSTASNCLVSLNDMLHYFSGS